MTRSQQFLEKFDTETQLEVNKWAKTIPSYDDFSQVSKEYWNKAREIVLKKHLHGDYWTNFFIVLDDLFASSEKKKVAAH